MYPLLLALKSCAMVGNAVVIMVTSRAERKRAVHRLNIMIRMRNLENSSALDSERLRSGRGVEDFSASVVVASAMVSAPSGDAVSSVAGFTDSILSAEEEDVVLVGES